MKKTSHQSLENCKIAVVYDRLTTQFGGAEQVLQALLELWSTADLWTSVYDPQRANWVDAAKVNTSWLQQLPLARNFYRAFVGLMPLAFESLDFSDYDIVISVTSGEAKGVLTKPEQLHLCYLLTPTRYLWSHTQHYQQSWSSTIRRQVFGYLRWWDQAAAVRPDVYVPISKLVARRCQTYYHRDCLAVLYPPVDAVPIQLALPKDLPARYWLMVGRLVQYKGFGQAIKAAAQLRQPLVIVGDGPDRAELEKMAANLNAPVQFRRTVQPDQLGAYYASCIGLLAPGEEDFGITTVEALAAGKPVIVHSQSGAAELVTDQQTGVLLDQHTEQELKDAMEYCRQHRWNAARIQQSVAGFTKAHFQATFRACLEAEWRRHQRRLQKGMT